MRLKEGLTVRKVGEDYVIVDPEQGMIDLSKVYSLNESAAWLWEQLQGKDFDTQDLIKLIKTQYDVSNLSEDKLAKDMKELINFFKESGLLIKE